MITFPTRFYVCAKSKFEKKNRNESNSSKKISIAKNFWTYQWQNCKIVLKDWLSIFLEKQK